MEKWDWIVDVFTFIGMIVCILIALIAIVWVTCFAVKLLIKTFNVKVGKSFELMSEDISKKAESKRERNEIKRKAAAEKKMELLNLKLESKQKVHEMKKQKLAEKLNNQEEIAKQKLFGENSNIELTNTHTEIEVESVEQNKIIEVENVVDEKNQTRARKSSKKSDKK